MIPFFPLMSVPLRCPDYSSVSKRAKSVNVSFKAPKGEIAHLVIDSTGLKVSGEGEWKVKKHGKERRHIWRKLHLAVDGKTHEVICADLSLGNFQGSCRLFMPPDVLVPGLMIPFLLAPSFGYVATSVPGVFSLLFHKLFYVASGFPHPLPDVFHLALRT